MLDRLFKRRSPSPAIASALYGAIVAQARNPAFYTGFGVADTVEGRLEMIMLHAVILLRHLREGSPAERAVGQAVFDGFCADVDRSLRELGVGDLSVPRKMKKIGESFYGRAAAYEPGLAAADRNGLAAALGRNVLGEPTPGGAAAALADYAIAAARGLAALPEAPSRAGDLPFPDPRAYMPVTAKP